MAGIQKIVQFLLVNMNDLSDGAQDGVNCYGNSRYNHHVCDLDLIKCMWRCFVTWANVLSLMARV